MATALIILGLLLIAAGACIVGYSLVRLFER